jgi:hypothetical protein
MCRERFRAVARGLQDQMVETIKQQVGLIEADLQVLGDSNAISESETDLEFKSRLRLEIHTIKEEVERLGNVLLPGVHERKSLGILCNNTFDQLI